MYKDNVPVSTPLVMGGFVQYVSERLFSLAGAILTPVRKRGDARDIGEIAFFSEEEDSACQRHCLAKAEIFHTPERV